MSHKSTEKDRAKAIAKKLIEFHTEHYDNLSFPGSSEAVLELLAKDSFALLLGIAFNGGQTAERAWDFPFQLERKNLLDPQKLNSMTVTDLENSLENLFEEPKFPEIANQDFKSFFESLPEEAKPKFAGMTAGTFRKLQKQKAVRKPRYGLHESAEMLKSAARLVMQFGGTANSIWQGASPKQVKVRVRNIRGVKQKKSDLLCRILYQRWGEFKGQEYDIDIPVDVHVMRVFKRTGITSSESKREAREAARVLIPSFPGALDWATFYIGKEWCRSGSPNCPACPLTTVCPKRVD